MLKTFQTEVERIGVRFVISESSQISQETVILVHGVPSVFVEREVSEVKRGRPSMVASNVKVIVMLIIGILFTFYFSVVHVYHTVHVFLIFLSSTRYFKMFKNVLENVKLAVESGLPSAWSRYQCPFEVCIYLS